MCTHPIHLVPVGIDVYAAQAIQSRQIKARRLRQKIYLTWGSTKHIAKRIRWQKLSIKVSPPKNEQVGYCSMAGQTAKVM